MPVQEAVSTENEADETSWKDAGNLAFKEEKWEEAIEAYSSGLVLSPSSVPLLSNRAAAYLRLRAYKSALIDADKALSAEPTHAKALYRKVKALHGLGLHSDACSFIQANLQRLNGYSEATKELGPNLLAEAQKREMEAAEGKYDMAQMVAGQLKEHECAEFRASGLAVQNVEGKGRGLIALETFQPGQLLIASKALAFVTSRTNRPPKSTTVPAPEESKSKLPVVESEIKADLPAARLQLMEELAKWIKFNPTMCREVYGLHAGPGVGHLKDQGSDEELLIDKRRLEKIVKFNSLWAEGWVTYEWKEVVGGLWLLPSFVNHACLGGNAVWDMYGNMLFVRAVRRIDAGSEVTFSYNPPDDSDASRQLLLATHRIKCTCPLCTLERTESTEVKEERLRLLATYEATAGTPGAIFSTDTEQLSQLVSELEALRPDPSLLPLTPYLFQPLKLLARRHFKKENYAASLEILLRLHEALEGSTLVKLRVTFSANIISAYLKLGNKQEEATQWVKTLKRDVQLAYGEPVNKILPLIAPDIVHKMSQNKMDI